MSNEPSSRGQTSIARMPSYDQNSRPSASNLATRKDSKSEIRKAYPGFSRRGFAYSTAVVGPETIDESVFVVAEFTAKAKDVTSVLMAVRVSRELFIVIFSVAGFIALIVFNLKITLLCHCVKKEEEINEDIRIIYRSNELIAFFTARQQFGFRRWV